MKTAVTPSTGHIFDWSKQIYSGSIQPENTLQSYINALTEVMDSYAKEATRREWIQTCFNEGHEAGHYVTHKIKQLDNLDCVVYVNRVFSEFTDVKKYMHLMHNFNYMPYGGGFSISGYIDRLKFELSKQITNN